MDKHAKRPSLLQYPVLAAFALFFLGLFVLDLATPDRAYSELENTTLAQRPKLTAPTADGLNRYFTDYTKYVKDQVFARDQWISLQSFAETALFQKTQNGGILLGKEHKMFPRRAGSPQPAVSRQGERHAGARRRRHHPGGRACGRAASG